MKCSPTQSFQYLQFHDQTVKSAAFYNCLVCGPRKKLSNSSGGQKNKIIRDKGETAHSDPVHLDVTIIRNRNLVESSSQVDCEKCLWVSNCHDIEGLQLQADFSTKLPHYAMQLRGQERRKFIIISIELYGRKFNSKDLHLHDFLKLIINVFCRVENSEISDKLKSIFLI